MLELVDISSNNGAVEWPHVRAAGIRGVWLKATEGSSYTDPTFAAHRTRAAAAGLRVGAYHFARPDHNSAAVEARHFAAVVGKVGRRELRPVLDLEVQGLRPHELEAWARTFNQQVHLLLHVAPAFYASTAYIAALELTRPIGDGLWLANYGVNDGHVHAVTAPRPWRRYIAHQYTSAGRVNGIVGNVDRSQAPRLRGILAFPVRGLL